MARVTTPTTNTRITSAWGANLRNDYLSQTDTTLQNILSSLDWPAGKRPKFPFAYFNPSGAPTATEGHVYYDSVEQKLKMYDGTQWRDIPATAGGGGTYKLPAYYTIYKDGSTYYAMDADGDVDYSGTNFATVTNNATSDCSAAGGGTVLVKNGTYTWTSAAVVLLLRTGVHLVGEGEGTVIQIPTDVAGADGAIKNENFNVSTDTDFTVENMVIDGQAVSQANDFGYIIFLCDVENVVFRRLHLKNANSWALNFLGGAVHTSKRCLVTECYGENCYDNFVIAKAEAAGAVSEIIVTNNFVTNCDTGIAFMGVNNSVIANNTCWLNNNTAKRTNGIDICVEGTLDCIGVVVANNVCDGEGHADANVGISILRGVDGLVANNTTTDHDFAGVQLSGSNVHNNLINGNLVYSENRGIYVSDDADQNVLFNNVIRDCEQGFQLGENDVGTNIFWLRGNYLEDCSLYGVRLMKNRVFLEGTTFIDTTAKTLFTNGAVQISDTGSDDSVVKQNTFSNLALGVNITAAAVSGVEVRHNKFDGCTANVTDSGTDTIFDSLVVSFVDGTLFLSADGSSWGWEIDANTEYAIALASLPPHVQQVMQLKIKAVSIVLEADAMRLQIDGYGGASNEAEGAETIAVVDKPSATTNFAADDYVYWLLKAADDADIDDLAGGDTVQIKVQHEAAGGADCATDAVFQTLEIDYV